MTSSSTGAAARITAAATAWPGVSAGPGDRGSWALRVGRREIGHLHGDRVAHFAFPKALCAELRAAGRVTRHPVDSPGLAARALHDDDDVRDVIALLRINYDRVVARHGVPAAAPAAAAP